MKKYQENKANKLKAKKIKGIISIKYLTRI